MPDLVDAAKTYKEVNDKTIKTLSEAMKQHPVAIIPVSELMKISQYVERTCCRLPDTDDLVKDIAAKLEKMIVPIVRQEVKEALGVVDFTVKHEHAHTTMKDLRDVVDNKTRRLVRGLIVANVILILIIGGILRYPNLFEKISSWENNLTKIF